MIIACHQKAIVENFQVEEDEQLTCVVLESDEDQVEGSTTVCRFVIQFPYCKIDVRQYNIIRSRVIQLLRAENVVSFLERQPVNDWESIIDPRSATDPWMLYGGTQHPDHKQLLLKHIYGHLDIQQIQEGEELVEYELSQVFNPLKHVHVEQGLVPISLFNECYEVDFWLPMFLSVHYWNQIVVLQPDRSPVQPRIPTATPRYQRRSVVQDVPISEESEQAIAERFLSMMKRERVESDHYWEDIGKCLYNIHSGDEQGLRSWIRFTERSDNHTAEECRKKYYMEFNLNNFMTLKTLAWYARIDSPEEYMAWHQAWCFPIMERATSGIHVDVADALYRVYWLEFVCASAKTKSWYMFKNHGWIKLDQGLDLKKKISADFRKRFEKMRTELSAEIQDSSDGSWKALAEVKIKAIGSLITKLGHQNYKTTLLKEAQENFHDASFLGKLDRSPKLMGLLNGVLEVCPTYACVRDGKPEDFVCKHSAMFWNPEMTWKHPLVKRCMYWLSQIFPDEELLDYAIRLFSSCLFGKNSNKILPILTGEGDNSKSMLKKLIEASFGPYCVTFPTILLTGKRASSSSPCPELAQADGAHMAFVQEPDGDDTLKAGTIKEFTGGDTFFARFLNQDGGAVVASFTLFLMCNKVPIIPNCDKAIKNRLRIVPFLSTWVDHAPETEEEQFIQRKFQKDPMFEQQIPELAPAFLWILAEKYADYARIGLGEPKIIKEYTSEYWNENDVYYLFEREYIEPAYIESTLADVVGHGQAQQMGQATLTPGAVPSERQRDHNAILSIRDLYNEFRAWFADSFPGTKCPIQATVKHEYAIRWGKPMSSGWRGIRLRTVMADIAM